MRVPVLFLTMALALTLSSCKSTGNAGASAKVYSGDQVPAASDSYNETILIGRSSPANDLVVFQLSIPAVPQEETPGEAAVQVVKKTPVQIQATGRLASTRNKHGRFYVAYESGKIVAIDEKTAAVVYDTTVAGGPIFDVEIDTEATAFVSFKTVPTIKKIDLRTGNILATIDIAAAGLAGATGLAPRRMMLAGETLYVGVDQIQQDKPVGGYLALVDRNGGAVRKTFDLSSPNRKALALLLPLVRDPFTNHLVIGAKGLRPANTGLTIRFDLTAEKVTEQIRPGTFNGLWSYSQAARKRIVLDHTSTPVSSTHVMQSTIAQDGSMTEDPEAVLDLFEETDNFSINRDGRLGMLPNRCPSGFCVVGKGVNFIDIRAGAKLPKLMSDAIGFDPDFAVFAGM